MSASIALPEPHNVMLIRQSVLARAEQAAVEGADGDEGLPTEPLSDLAAAAPSDEDIMDWLLRVPSSQTQPAGSVTGFRTGTLPAQQAHELGFTSDIATLGPDTSHGSS